MLPVAVVEPSLEMEQRRIEQELDQILPAGDAYPSSIHRAMRYAVFAGGKRLRPILCIETGRLFGGADAALLRVAAALELIHTYLRSTTTICGAASRRAIGLLARPPRSWPAMRS